MRASDLELIDAMDEADIDFDPGDVDGMFASMLEQMAAHERIVLVAGPRSGKSTLAARASERFKVKARHADSLVHRMEWSEMSDEVAGWLSEPGRWIVEGVVTARAIRKWLSANPGPVPFAVVHMPRAIQIRTDKQEAMAKGVGTVWDEIAPELAARKTTVVSINYVDSV